MSKYAHAIEKVLESVINRQAAGNLTESEQTHLINTSSEHVRNLFVEMSRDIYRELEAEDAELDQHLGQIETEEEFNSPSLSFDPSDFEDIMESDDEGEGDKDEDKKVPGLDPDQKEQLVDLLKQVADEIGANTDSDDDGEGDEFSFDDSEEGEESDSDEDDSDDDTSDEDDAPSDDEDGGFDFDVSDFEDGEGSTDSDEDDFNLASFSMGDND